GRVMTRVVSPRDLASLRRGLESYPELLAATGPDGESGDGRGVAAEASALLAAAIADDPAPVVGDGGVVRTGFSTQLDEARDLTGDARKALAELETEERERTGIRSLRVAYNRVFGYYIEV